MVISYGSTGTELTNGSELVCVLARLYCHKYRDAVLAFSTFSKTNLSSRNEVKEKERIFRDRGFKLRWIGDVSSSTDECLALRKVSNISKRSILVIAEGAHSRRCKKVWEYLFPNADIRFRSVPAWDAADPKNPMWFQRNWRVWLLLNILAYPLYCFGPTLRWIIKKNPSQPV